MIKDKISIWQGKTSKDWFILDRFGRLWIEETFKDAIIRSSLIIMDSEIRNG